MGFGTKLSRVVVAALVTGWSFTSSRAQQSEPTDSTKRRGLELSEFADILSTESVNEFGLYQLEEANDLWDNATSYEWARAKKLEHNGSRRQLDSTDAPDGLSPFIVCDIETGKSGYDCRKTIASHFGEALMAIFNADDKTCYFVSSKASVAETAPSPLVVQPLLPEAKLQIGMVDTIEEADPLPSRLYAMFCPGHSGSKDEANLLAHSIMDSIKGNGSNGRHLVKDTFLRRAPEEANDAPAGHIRKKAYHRSLVWRNALEDGFNSDQCIETISQFKVAGSHKGSSVFFDVPDSALSSCVHSFVAALSISPEVCSVGIVPDMEATNLEAQWITQSGVEDERPWFASGLTGGGQVVAVSDSGLDVDNCYFLDESGDDVRKDGSIDLSQRKVVQYTPYADASDDRLGHGTHVVGTVVGRRAEDGITETDGAADGIAMDARVAFFDIGRTGSPYLAIPEDVSELLNPGKEAGAKIHSASWGSEYNGYGIDEYNFDDYMFEHEDCEGTPILFIRLVKRGEFFSSTFFLSFDSLSLSFSVLMVVAAGNSGPSRGSVGSPATSKNIVSVGASQSSGDDITTSMLGKDYLAKFSSRGPTADGRTKPEVVAPGYYIKSAGAQPSIRGECDNSDGVHFLAGTSMATPVVSGTAALIRQYFEEGYYPTGKQTSSDAMSPSGSLVKAVLLNGAQMLFGAEGGNWWWGGTSDVEPYDQNQNFGRISLIHSLPLEGENKIRTKVIDRKIILAGDTDKIVVDIDKSGGCEAFELSTTLVWVDPPAAPNCRQCLLNDLDLFVSKEGESRTVFANGREGRDTVNNSERVRVPAADGERFVINVEARNLSTKTQKYALAITGCIKEERSTNPNPPVTEPTPSPIEPTPEDPEPTPAPANPVAPEPTPAPVEDPNANDPSIASIMTTLDGTDFWYGNMFNVYAKQDISVQSIDIHTMSEETVSVRVWTKGGSLVGSHKSGEGWAMIASTNVEGRGIGELTPIPPEAFASTISIGAGDTQAFYVTLDTKDMLLTDGNEFNRVYAENNDLAIQEGTAHTYPFGDYFYPYIWNGAFNYLRDEVASIVTTFESETNYLGNMFDVEANTRNVVVTGMDIHTLSIDMVDIEIWTKPGYYEGNTESSEGWGKIVEGTIQGLGKGSRTRIPDNMWEAVPIAKRTIPAASAMAFYVTFTSADAMLYKRSGSTFSNTDLTISAGAALNYPFEDVYPDRTWNGVLRYETE